MIKLLVFDVDGTLSDGKVYYTQSGEEIKSFDIRDGLAISVWNRYLARPSAIITGRDSQIVRKRAAEVGIEHIFMGVENKAEVLRNLLAQLNLADSEVACIGDDLNDLGMFRICKKAYMPSNGAKALKKYAYKILKSRGGDGAVREMIEDVLKLNGDKKLEKYFL
ncbi:3-deoxy-D-manno-octulosonate 8-phosphate phosphatase [Helicobacter jaachi]|uniref:3-deoxy-D-manno-octulosonate 8-phosphate phosphatase n=1 Tax=Helicobacter jaachi TaxID=1677920 RepID=A0A4U8TBT7_9HELI|nr:HAD hydrolase family protein [Helicobacter jaachi]TLD97253.1 3-deoxy-D-manno-octulosonate 8-phosphate phosphatase [Helicobacter jaachi]